MDFITKEFMTGQKEKSQGSPSLWLEQALQGDSGSYQQFLRWAADFTRSLAQKRLSAWRLNTNELLDDFVQEILITIHQKRNTYMVGLPVEPWLAGIIKFKSIDWLRKVIVENRHLSFEEADSAQNFSPEAVHDVAAALATLNETQRRMVEMAKIEGLSIEEISEETGYSTSAVKVSIHRAMKTLQKKFGGEPK